MDRLADLVLAFHALPGISDLSVRLPAMLCSMHLAPDYILPQWYNDTALEREKRSLALTLLTRSPYIEAHNLSHAYLFEGHEAVGLGLAAEADGVGASLLFDQQRWAEPFVTLQTTRPLRHCLEGQTEEIKVRHASSPEHIAVHEAWLRPPPFLPRDGRELWAARDEHYPSLCFCDHVERQLQATLVRRDLREDIPRKLSALECYFAGWGAGPFDRNGLGVRVHDESAATLQQYADERTFTCPDGLVRLFRLHIHLAKGHRLYFCPEHTTRQCFIGFVGPHPRSHDFR